MALTNQNKEKLIKFLKKLLLMIEQDATGYDLAYEIENYDLKRDLLHDGIVFYETFLKIGNKRVKDIPNEEKKDYKTFKIIEDSHKQLFFNWAKELIKDYEKPKFTKSEYVRYKKSKEKWFSNELHCEKCGARIKDKNQEICEECGEVLKI